MSSPTLTVGALFHGKYRLESLLGSGGFARVYLATDEQLGRRVALKILHPAGASSVAPTDEKLDRFFKRFEREAKVISRLRAPEIVAVYEFGKTDDGLAFMALEYVDGRNLWQIMQSEGTLPGDRVECILTGVLRGLREAHSLGVHHRDLKPANIMVYDHFGERDLVKLLDFGVVKITRDVGVSYSSLTSEGNVVGTPRYMAPEYITDNVVTPQTDLYSLGLVAYELIVGEPVVTGETALEVMSAHITPESAKLPDGVAVSPQLRAVVDGLLIKDTSLRFATADDVLRQLAEEDASSLAATMESDAFYELASKHGPDATGADVDAPVEIVVPVDAETGRRDEAVDPEVVVRPKRRPSQVGQGLAPVEQQVKQSGVDRRIVAFAVILGVVVGAVIWWVVRT